MKNSPDGKKNLIKLTKQALTPEKPKRGKKVVVRIYQLHSERERALKTYEENMKKVVKNDSSTEKSRQRIVQACIGIIHTKQARKSGLMPVVVLCKCCESHITYKRHKNSILVLKMEKESSLSCLAHDRNARIQSSVTKNGSRRVQGFN